MKAEKLNPFLDRFEAKYVRTYLEYINAPGADKKNFYDVEAEKFIRIYVSPVLYERVERLSDAAHKLFRWIMYHISKDAITIKFNDKKLCELFKCSERNLIRMRTDLVNNAFISKKVDNEYWINPMFFAVKARMELYPGNAKQVHTRYDV